MSGIRHDMKMFCWKITNWQKFGKVWVADGLCKSSFSNIIDLWTLPEWALAISIYVGVWQGSWYEKKDNERGKEIILEWEEYLDSMGCEDGKRTTGDELGRNGQEEPEEENQQTQGRCINIKNRTVNQYTE